MVKKLLCIAIIPMLLVKILFSQTTLERMLTQTEANYPVLKANRYNTEAAAHALKAGRNDFFPKATIAYQGNYATANNISGMTFPGHLLPISGPPSAGNDYTLVSGSAASLLMTWSPFTFNQRSSHVGRLRAEAEEASMEEALALFLHQIRFIETYLDYQEVLILEEALQAELERLEYSLTLSRQLSINGIRPGVDTATVKAEYAKSQVEWLKSHSLNPANRVEMIEADVMNADNKLQAGMFAKAEIPFHTDQIWVVPTAAIITNLQERFVVKVLANGQHEKVAVVNGLQNDNLTQISGNLNAGDNILLNAREFYQ